ncbi:MAG: insulinase family protein, partial [Bacteroidales bacterium]|nr:insulinase family protein [Bacteroidales bacterium]
RIYELDNGLKVYLSQNQDEPRIQTFIAVRAGSTYDPAETTGLAHYFEHMMFKGTDDFGTMNWEAEKVYIDKITALFEKHRATEDPDEKARIYHQIDSLSGIAAQFAVANEYDKMMTSMGAQGTNAGTSNEFTVYMNNIPANQLEKWIMLEAERFSDPVLRIFHTELETVYEEFNMSQDNDGRKLNRALMEGLFPTHPYGTQTTLGEPEHLKNPSMVNIMNYFDTYYVPNNMAFALSGDIDFAETVQLINEYWGNMEPNPALPERDLPVEAPITEPLVKEVVGPEAETMRLGFRFDGANSKDEKYVTMIDNILSNSQAGLIDLDLNQEQKVLRAGSYASFMIDYGMHVFYGNPRQGQSLDEVKELLLKEIEKIKKGNFEDWMLEAIINDMRLQQMRRQEGNFKAWSFVDAFIKNIDWAEEVQFIDELEKITKEELVQFANEHYQNNYVVVYKKTGKDTTSVKLEKPPITPVELNREAQSEFFKEFMSEQPENLEPVFVDFDEKIKKDKLKTDVDFRYIHNKTNDIFSLYYIIDMGKDHDLQLPIAVNYLPYLGTDQYSPAELKQEFFKLGLRMGVSTGDDRSYVYVSGLDKSFEKAIELLEHVLANAKPDQEVYDEYVKGIQKKRADAKLNKNTILWSGLFNYGKYGAFNPFTNIMQEEELKNLNPEFLTDLIKNIYAYDHSVFYYGPKEMQQVNGILSEQHPVPDELLDFPEEVEYNEEDTDENKVYFVNYDMVQTNILMLSKDGMFNKDLIPASRLFGEYYGSGLSSIVFQDIREARGLAYSAFAAFSVPGEMDESNYVYTFVATQADKLEDATEAMLNLMNEMPEAKAQFKNAKEAIQTQIETERITKANIFWTWLSNQERGIDYDIRKDVYEYAKNVNLEDFEAFFDEYIQGRNYNYLIIGNRDLLDMKKMKKLGKVEELTLEEIFNY